MSRKTLNLTDELHSYMLSISPQEPDVLRRLRLETESLPEGEMQIAKEQGYFISLLVQLLRAKKVLEVGTFTGYSALWTAFALPADGKLIACDVSEEWTSIALRYWAEAGVAGKVDLRLAPALETMDGLIREGQGGTFDFIFIDADKENYPGYYEHALQLVRKGGLIAIDNIFRRGRSADPHATDPETLSMRAFNESLSRDARVQLSVVPIADGLTLAMKR